jgi:hypothetical protein
MIKHGLKRCGCRGSMDESGGNGVIPSAVKICDLSGYRDELGPMRIQRCGEGKVKAGALVHANRTQASRKS